MELLQRQAILWFKGTQDDHDWLKKFMALICSDHAYCELNPMCMLRAENVPTGNCIGNGQSDEAQCMPGVM